MYSIPSSRTYAWGDHCGIPGGIPTRETIYTTLSYGATVSQINSAISACPAGQVVKLGPGTFGSGINMKAGITLRGSGAGITTTGRIDFGGSDFDFATSYGSAIANGSWLNAGSYSVTLSSTPGSSFQVGRMILINQEDDHVLVFPRTGNWAGTRNLRHISRITDVTGNTVTFSTPIPYGFSYAQNPKAQAITAVSLGGVEELTIDSSTCIDFTGTDRCWAYKCEMTGGDNEHVFLRSCHQTEIRKCYIHDSDGFPTISDGFGIYAQYAVGGVLAVDNIGYHLSHMFIMNGDSAGAYIYNYAWALHWDSRNWVWPAYNCNHGPHPIMNLWEGNIGERWQNDTYHGTASHQTLFRNHIHGVNPYSTSDRRIMDFCRVSYYFNAVGNVVGDSSWTPDYYQASKVTGTGYHTGALDREDSYLWVLGYPNSESGSLSEETTLTGFTPPGGTYPDSGVVSTLIRHANYDYYNEAQVWADSDHDIADSLFYDSKPSWFGSLTWPPIEPDGPTLNDNPAKWRWDKYQETSDFNYLFTDDIGEITGWTNTFDAAIIVSESETARLYVEYPHVRVVAGTSATYTIWAEAYNDFTADITLDATGLPTNATDSYGTNPMAYNGSSVATITTTDVAAGTYSIYFTGTAVGGEVGSVRVILEVVESDDCSVKVPIRKIRVKQGDSAVFTVIADPTSGYTGAMDLSDSGVPTGATAEFGSDQIDYNESTTYTVDSGTAAVGGHEITITGEGPA